MPNTTHDRLVADGTTVERSHESLDEALAKLPGLPTLPQTALEILALARNLDAVTDDYYQLISVDPALSVRVLKVVNSSFYGLSRQVDSIRQAIVLLGPNAVRNIAVASSMHKVFCAQRPGMRFDPQSLWTHSVAVATAARRITEHVGFVEPETAFLSGLIHDIGLIAELQWDHPKFTTLLKLAADEPETPFRELEVRYFGGSHEEFGAALCRVWKLPEHLEAVAAFHHHPQDCSDSHRTIVAIVHVADVLAAQSGIGYARTVESVDLAPDLLEEIGLTTEVVEAIQKELPDGVSENRELFEV